MKVFLHHRADGLYYAGPQQWTQDRARAADLHSFPEAVETCRRNALAHMDAILVSEAVRGEAAVPLLSMPASRPGVPFASP